MSERGERELSEAKKMKEDVAIQSELLQSELAELREKEQRIAAVSWCMHAVSGVLIPSLTRSVFLGEPLTG